VPSRVIADVCANAQQASYACRKPIQLSRARVVSFEPEIPRHFTHIHGADVKDVIKTKVDLPELPVSASSCLGCLGIQRSGTQSELIPPHATLEESRPKLTFDKLQLGNNRYCVPRLVPYCH
jgi:hypothetical protein